MIIVPAWKQTSNIPKSMQTYYVHLDIVGPLPPSSSNRYLLTAVDRYTRWPEAFPMPDISAETVTASFLSMWILRFRVPSPITTDRGRQFESRLFTAFATLLDTTRLRTTSYHPASNGMVERLHRHLKSALIARGERDHWVSHLPLVLLGIRAALKPELGCSCAELVYGCSLRLPAEFLCPSKPDISSSALLQRLHRSFSIVRATPSRAPSHHIPNIPQDLPMATHVFLRTDLVRKSLSPPYCGKEPVLAGYLSSQRIPCQSTG
ncbi:protein NYNRIN-like [Ornithodoros turicata]|uniref:protein NYNRIN-like n=1 Tax=Ornithodoros turicata TaxID=34597 RepID=UPI00313A2279